VIDLEEDVLIQTLLPEFAVEHFDKRVLLRFSGLNEIDLDVRPHLKCSCPELRPIVATVKTMPVDQRVSARRRTIPDFVTQRQMT
jgi:hypothetical protein